MSLLRLLTTGKSLEGMDASVNRYQVTRERLLPKFGGVANPFKATTKPSSAVEHEQSPKAPAARVTPAATIPAAGATIKRDLKERMRALINGIRGGWWLRQAKGSGVFAGKSPAELKSEHPAPAAPVLVTQEKKLSPVQRCVGWLTGNRKIKWFSRARVETATKPATVFHPSAKGPSQGELLLDQVKPVRNDLCDSDLEVVTAPKAAPETVTKPASAPAPTAEPAAESSSSDRAWERVGRQLMETGKS